MYWRRRSHSRCYQNDDLAFLFRECLSYHSYNCICWSHFLDINFADPVAPLSRLEKLGCQVGARSLVSRTPEDIIRVHRHQLQELIALISTNKRATSTTAAKVQSTLFATKIPDHKDYVSVESDVSNTATFASKKTDH